MIVNGQQHGGVAQGIGQALYEHAVYDRATAQLVTGSFMDYAMPHADLLPNFEIALEKVRCKTNPMLSNDSTPLLVTSLAQLLARNGSTETSAIWSRSGGKRT